MKILLPPTIKLPTQRIELQRHSVGHAVLTIDGHAQVLKRSELAALVNQINAIFPKLR